MSTENSTDESTLSAQEREFARRLAAAKADRDVPSAALDHSVLAMARAQLQNNTSSVAADASIATPIASSPASTSSHTRRWRRRTLPLALGTAASLVLAVGFAWQLSVQRDQQLNQMPVMSQTSYEVEQVHREGVSYAPSAEEVIEYAAIPPSAADAAAPPPVADGAKAPAQNAAAKPIMELEGHAAAAPVAASRQQRTTEQTTRRVPMYPQSGDEYYSAAADTVAADAVTPVPAPEPIAAPAAAKATAEDSVSAEASTNSLDSIRVTGTKIESAASKQRYSHRENARIQSAPATAIPPDKEQLAWLERIRKLVNDGFEADARASMQEFQRRHPNAPVPDDLRYLSK